MKTKNLFRKKIYECQCLTCRALVSLIDDAGAKLKFGPSICGRLTELAVLAEAGDAGLDTSEVVQGRRDYAKHLGIKLSKDQDPDNDPKHIEHAIKYSNHTTADPKHTPCILGNAQASKRDGRFFLTWTAPSDLNPLKQPLNSPITPTTTIMQTDIPLNQILYGPPGTGKTFNTINEALAILDPACLAENNGANSRPALKARFDELVKNEWIRFVTFHQSFSYEDFVEGLRADNNASGQLKYQVEDGVFKLLCDQARAPLDTDKKLPYVLIIDEINRGNVSRIFGELITLIEPSKRSGQPEALEVILPYSKKRFSVPDNVYIIGTMNTTDRSLAGMDIALRRRFSFKEMPPRPSELSGVMVEGVDIAALLTTMNQRIEVLLDRDHCLGHSYFLELKTDNSRTKLSAIFRHQILPLLKEYFFEDWERIHWVLNDHRKKDVATQFVKQADNNINTLFGTGPEISAENQRWQLNEAALNNIQSYLRIIAA